MGSIDNILLGSFDTLGTSDSQNLKVSLLETDSIKLGHSQRY